MAYYIYIICQLNLQTFTFSNKHLTLGRASHLVAYCGGAYYAVQRSTNGCFFISLELDIEANKDKKTFEKGSHYCLVFII